MTPDYLAIIDAKIARLQDLREELVELAAPQLIAAAARGAGLKALPAGKAGAPAPGSKELGHSPVVPRMLRELAVRGPLQLRDLARALGADSHHVGYHLKSKTALFRQLPGHRRSPWELTDAGRKAAAALPPAV